MKEICSSGHITSQFFIYILLCAHSEVLDSAPRDRARSTESSLKQQPSQRPAYTLSLSIRKHV